MAARIVMNGRARRERCTWCGSPFHHACGAHNRAHRPHRFHVRAHAGLIVSLIVAGAIAVAVLVQSGAR